MREQALALRSIGLSHEKIAQQLGTSHSTVRRWTDPDYAERQRVAKRVRDERLERRRRWRHRFWADRGLPEPAAIPYARFLVMLGGEW